MTDEEQTKRDIAFMAAVVARIYGGHYTGDPSIIERLEKISYVHRPKDDDDAREETFKTAYKNMAEEW